MRTIQDWLAEYDDSHQTRTNKILHWICVPLIMLSLLGLLWPLAIPFGENRLPFNINWAIVTVIFALIYYTLISWPLAAGMLAVSVLMLFILDALSGLTTPLWIICGVTFIVSWVGQFIGHHVEGRRPSFFRDVQFLLIGPLWLLAFLYRRLGIPY